MTTDVSTSATKQTPQHNRRHVVGKKLLLTIFLVPVSFVCWKLVRDAVQRDRDAWLLSSAAKVSVDMTLDEARKMMGQEPDSESVEMVVWNGSTLMTPENSRASEYGDPQRFHLIMWQGGRRNLTILSSDGEHVTGTLVSSQSPSPSLIDRLLSRLRSLF